MQDSTPAQANKPSRLPNPFLDFAVTGLEAQLKFWQAFQVEGARFVAKRMRNDLEQLRALGHCCDAQSMGDCQLAWVREIQKDYAEELARLAATSFTLGFTDLTGLGWLFGKRAAQASRETQAIGPKSKPGFPAAA
ncbi:MAG: hypothetical protein WBW51_00625 [Methyloceanibacter sp.]